MMESVATETMRAARLHGVGDLRVEQLARPVPEAGELLVGVEACGVCPTDVRKFQIGVNDGDYPFNPGHEWLGRVVEVGADVDGWRPGDRVYGDTYAGYAQFARLAVDPGPWSAGPVRVPDGLPAERAVFVEPLADCLHAVRDQARVTAGATVVIVGLGQMGLQLVAAAAVDGGRVLAVEPREDRRALGRTFGAEEVVGPDDLGAAAAAFSGGAGVDVVILSIPAAGLVGELLRMAAPGGRIVLFAGFGDRPEATLDLNLIHYRELSLLGSEWIGTPPHQRRERYGEALDLIVGGRVPVDRLVTGRCGLDGLPAAFADVQALRGLKTVLVP